jgi:hypothetical protein
MTLFTQDVPSSDQLRTYSVSIAEAEKGEFAGKSYFTCNCPNGRTKFDPGHPCKHIRQVAAKFSITIPASGHFDRPAGI